MRGSGAGQNHRITEVDDLGVAHRADNHRNTGVTGRGSPGAPTAAWSSAAGYGQSSALSMKFAA